MLHSAEFHCATAALNKLEDDILHQCHYGRSLMLIFGAPGSGRTHLSERLRAQLSRSLPTALVEAHPLLSADQLDADALTQLGLHQLAAGHLDLAVAVQRAPAGRRVLLVDNAHDLHLSILRNLVNIAAAEREREDPRVLIVMLGDDMLEAALAEFEFGGLLAQDLHRVIIPNLSYDDAQRMATAWAATLGIAEPDKSFVRDACIRAQALPGPFLEALKMNSDNQEQEQLEFEERSESGDETLMSDVRMSAEEESERRSNWLMTPLIMLGVLVLALLLLYQAEISAWISGKPASENVVNQNEQSARTDIAIAPENVNDQTVVAGDSGIEVVTSPAATETPIPNAEAVTNPAASITFPTTTTEAPIVVAANLPPVVEAKLAVKSESKIESKTDVKKDTAKVENKAKPSEVKPTETKRDSNSADEQTLLAMKGSHFVVQIVALSEEKAIKQFITQYGLKKTKYYRAERNGRTMYFLVQPEYADHGAAEKARDALPEAVRKQKPWIKQLSVIQQEIRAGAKAR